MNVLFVCVGNSGRSVMAERLFRRVAGEEHTARSAGSHPGTATHSEPTVVEALRELGVDASDHVPHRLDDEDVAWADVVVAACDVACPVVPGKRYENWGVRDPHGRPIEDVRAIRDEIAGRVDQLVAELAPG
jgi:protein-tyrosine-phosphatase